MYNFKIFQEPENQRATRDALDYLIRHINKRTDLLQTSQAWVLDQYNQDHTNPNNRSGVLFNFLLNMYNYLYPEAPGNRAAHPNERDGDQRDASIWVDHRAAHMGKRSRGSKMPRYNISPYTKQKAKEIGVTVSPSTRKGKKIDVFKNGKKVASVGAKGYNDFTTYSRKNKFKANERRRLYHIRHKKDSAKKGTPGYYAAKLLW